MLLVLDPVVIYYLVYCRRASSVRQPFSVRWRAERQAPRLVTRVLNRMFDLLEVLSKDRLQTLVHELGLVILDHDLELLLDGLDVDHPVAEGR